MTETEWISLREAQEILETNPLTAVSLRTLQAIMADPSRRAQEWEREGSHGHERGWRTRHLLARKEYLLRRSWVFDKVNNAG